MKLQLCAIVPGSNLCCKPCFPLYVPLPTISTHSECGLFSLEDQLAFFLPGSFSFKTASSEKPSPNSQLKVMSYSFKIRSGVMSYSFCLEHSLVPLSFFLGASIIICSEYCNFLRRHKPHTLPMVSSVRRVWHETFHKVDAHEIPTELQGTIDFYLSCSFLALRESLMPPLPCEHRRATHTHTVTHLIWEPDSFLIDLGIMQNLIICGPAFDLSGCPIWKKGLVPTYL